MRKYQKKTNIKNTLSTIPIYRQETQGRKLKSTSQSLATNSDEGEWHSVESVPFSHTVRVCVCECECVSSDSKALKVDKTQFTNYTLLRHFFCYIHPVTSAKSSAYKTKVCSK